VSRPNHARVRRRKRPGRYVQSMQLWIQCCPPPHPVRPMLCACPCLSNCSTSSFLPPLGRIASNLLHPSVVGPIAGAIERIRITDQSSNLRITTSQTDSPHLGQPTDASRPSKKLFVCRYRTRSTFVSPHAVSMIRPPTTYLQRTSRRI
jgi:hypothetical protein